MKKLKSILCRWCCGFTPTEVECIWQSREAYRVLYEGRRLGGIDMNEKEYRQFSEWVDNNKSGELDVDEAVRLSIDILNRVLNGERFIDGNFKKRS